MAKQSAPKINLGPPVSNELKGVASTFFMLCAEFGTAQIPLRDCCEKFFGLSEKEASRRAIKQQFPFPVYRGGSQRSKWIVRADDLAIYLDEIRAESLRDWQKLNGSNKYR